MGKYWLTSPFVIVDGATGRKIGRIALKWKRDNIWNIVLCRGGKETYITRVKLSDELSWIKLVELLPKAQLSRICPNYEILYCPLDYRFGRHELPARGFKLVDMPSGLSVWVRMGRKRMVYTLCLCQGFRIVKKLSYLRHGDVVVLKSLVGDGDVDGIRKVLLRLGFELPEEPRRSVEDEGWGSIVQEQLEDGTFEEELISAVEDGDRERAQWLLNSPEDARIMGVDEKIIKWAFGEEGEDENEE